MLELFDLLTNAGLETSDGPESMRQLHMGEAYEMHFQLGGWWVDSPKEIPSGLAEHKVTVSYPTTDMSWFPSEGCHIVTGYKTACVRIENIPDSDFYI